MKKIGVHTRFYSLQDLDKRLKSLEELLRVKSNKAGLDLINNQKCGSTYSKTDLASLFYFLMDEEILFFNKEDSKMNRSRFQEFIIENFTYSMGSEGHQLKITSISKQFSESKGFCYREKQIKFLEEFITRIQNRKKRIEKW